MNSLYSPHLQGSRGKATLTILMEDGARALEAAAGELIILPVGHWHRFHAPDGVTVMTGTLPRTRGLLIDKFLPLFHDRRT